MGNEVMDALQARWYGQLVGIFQTELAAYEAEGDETAANVVRRMLAQVEESAAKSLKDWTQSAQTKDVTRRAELIRAMAHAYYGDNQRDWASNICRDIEAKGYSFDADTVRKYIQEGEGTGKKISQKSPPG